MAAVAEADVEAVAEAAGGVEDGAVAVVGVAGSKRLALSRRFLRLFRKAPRATSFSRAISGARCKGTALP